MPVAPPMPVSAPAAQTTQEKLFELLSFDKIDDRVEKSDQAPYDMTARLIGRGVASTGGAYLLPYLQSGHMLLLGVLLLCSIVSYPGARPATAKRAATQAALAERQKQASEAAVGRIEQLKREGEQTIAKRAEASAELEQALAEQEREAAADAAARIDELKRAGETTVAKRKVSSKSTMGDVLTRKVSEMSAEEIASLWEMGGQSPSEAELEAAGGGLGDITMGDE